MSIAQLIKAFFVPGSPEFLVLALLAGVALLHTPTLERWGRRWLTMVALGYVVMSVPQTTAWLLDLVVGTPPRVHDAADAAGARTVVLLGNGAHAADDGKQWLHFPSVETAYNTLEAARLYHVLGSPRIIASGGGVPGHMYKRTEAGVMRELLIDLGVPAGAIVLEPHSRTTYRQAVNIARMVDRSQPIVLVTVPRHMPRSRALFEAQGMRVIPSASMYDLERRAWYWRWWLPSRHAMRMSEMLVYERLARVNAWLAGQYERAEAPAAVVEQ